jgi:hypothetical protein
MGLFRRTPRWTFPADMWPWLETFGRYSLDMFRSRIDSRDVGSHLPSLLDYARADREGFLAELTDFVAGDEGGFATFGAARVVWEMFGTECLSIPAALPLIDAGIEFKRARGLPGGMFTGYEMRRMEQILDQR